MSGARIEMIGLQKSYPLGSRSVDVLRGLDATIEAGDRVAVVGTSGAGKSTLLHILGTLDSPTSGVVRIDGVDVQTLSQKQLAHFRNQTIGFVFQFHYLLPEFTALENVCMPAMIAGHNRTDATVYAKSLLERVGLEARMDHRPGELSGGEQQRVALARALMMRPRLLLADEPTGNLDTQTGNAIHELMVELNQERGMTMVVVTHNEDLANRLPRRFHMQDGRLLDVAQPPISENRIS